MSKHIWLHAAKSVRFLFVATVLGLILIDLLTIYVDISPLNMFFFSLIAITPSLISVRLAHSNMADLYYIPAMVVFVTGAVVVSILAMGCEVQWFTESCFGGIAGPAAVLGVMMSWAGITFAMGYESHRLMLQHGRVR